jgi:hypothetical protein
MNRLLVGAVTAGGSLALAGGALVAAATPAAATMGSGNSAYGASAPNGPINSPPLALASANGPNSVTVHGMNINGLLTTGLTQDFASTVTAYSRVNSVDASAAARGSAGSLTASQVASTCRSDSQTASADIVNGVLDVDGMILHLPQQPSVDQVIPLGSLGTLTLNQQIPAPGGGLEVQGAHLHFTGSEPAEDLYLAVSVCSSPGTIGNTVSVTSPGDQTDDVDTPIDALHISASDSDPGQTLTYSATGLPPGLSINATTGVITGTPSTDSGSPYAVTVTATDTTGASGSATFTWFIDDGI